MGYACPVCGDPQSDGAHLANHLAFTAMLGDDDHEAWLDEHVSDWAETSPAELAPRVTDHAAETEFPQVFEDATDGAGGGRDDGRNHGHDHTHDTDRRPDPLAGADVAAPGDVSDPSALFDADDAERDAEDVLAEARELTRQQWANVASEDADSEDDAADGRSSSAGDSADDAPSE